MSDLIVYLCDILLTFAIAVVLIGAAFVALVVYTVVSIRSERHK